MRGYNSLCLVTSDQTDPILVETMYVVGYASQLESSVNDVELLTEGDPLTAIITSRVLPAVSAGALGSPTRWLNSILVKK